jgi:hypothetical protein
MSASRIGTSTHELLHHFELAKQRFRRMGIDARVSDRLALAMALRLTSNCNQDQAWEMVNEIFPRATQPPADFIPSN